MTVYAERTIRWFHNSYTVDDETGCHIWHGRVHHGKATMQVGTKELTTRRVAYAIAFGEDPSDDIKIMMSCDNRLCVNVEHFVLTRKSLLVSEGTKHCSKCKEVKPLAAFPPCKTGAGGVFNYCRVCFASHKRNIYARDPDVKYKSRLRTYGITQERYESMYRAQKGRCAICGGLNGERALAIDHDHGSGKVRALLCGRCNGGIALLMHDPALVSRALDYLLTWDGVISGMAQQLPLDGSAGVEATA